METATTPVLTAAGLSKSYGKHHILSSVSLEAYRGECIGILGANGCGKSTLLSILSGCLKADSGTIQINGHAACKKADFVHTVGYVPQENPLFSSLSVLDNLRYFYADSPVSLKEELEHGIPHLFGLNDYLKKKVTHLSGGMKRRLAIACALSNHPPVLLLDEPGASLDFVCKEDILQYLRSYQKEGGTVILTSHEQTEIALCNRLFLLEQGSLLPLESQPDFALLTERMRTHEATTRK